MNADHEFLRAMSDHHAGLILLAHAAVESNQTASLQPAIRRIEEDHDEELDTMLRLLQRLYRDQYVPRPGDDYRRTAQTLRAGRGSSTMFFQMALNTEEHALDVAVNYLSKARNAEVRKFAEDLRRDEPKEIRAIRTLLERPDLQAPLR